MVEVLEGPECKQILIPSTAPGLPRRPHTYLSAGSSQFGGQAPGTSEEERQFAYSKFGFEFPVMDKVDVNGEEAHPLYKYLRASQPVSLPSSQGTLNPFGEPGAIEWNCALLPIELLAR